MVIDLYVRLSKCSRPDSGYISSTYTDILKGGVVVVEELLTDNSAFMSKLEAILESKTDAIDAVSTVSTILADKINDVQNSPFNTLIVDSLEYCQVVELRYEIRSHGEE